MILVVEEYNLLFQQPTTNGATKLLRETPAAVAEHGEIRNVAEERKTPDQHEVYCCATHVVCLVGKEDIFQDVAEGQCGQ